MRLDVYSDPICPWCYIGHRHLAAALEMLAADGVQFAVRWRPFQLNPDMPQGGMARAAYRTQKFGSAERSAELDREVVAAARIAGIEMRFDRMTRTPNTLDAHRLIQHAGGWQDAVVEALFTAYFEQGQDIGDRTVLLDAAESVGMDRPATAAFLDSDVGHDEIMQADAAVRRAGLQGVPSFALNDHIVLQGAVPAGQMAARLGAAYRHLSAQLTQP